MKSKHLIPLLALLAGAPFAHAGSHTWSGAANGYWNNDANWSSGGKPVAGETNVALFFPLAASRVVVTNNIPGLKISTIALNGDYTLHGSGGATLDFAGANAGITVNGARTNLIASSLPIVLNDSLLFHFSNAAGHLKVYSVMSGAGGVTKNNAGTLTFGGTLPNTYSGTTLVRSGTLVLGKSAGFPATGRVSVPGPLVIGNGVTAATVRLDYSHQLANTAPVTVNTNAILDLNSHSEVIGPLTLHGNTLDSGTGLLTLNGDVTVNKAATVATIAGRLSLGTATRTFHTEEYFVAGPPDLLISAGISGDLGAGLIKNGDGDLSLSSSNSYSGPTTINRGAVYVDHSFALGSTNGGTTINEAQLFLRNGARVGLEPLTINGSADFARLVGSGASNVTNSWAGDITLAMDTQIYAYQTLILSGAIGGPGSVTVVTAFGKLIFAGNAPNTYAGATIVEEGVLQLDKANGVAAVPGSLIVGTTNVADPATVLLTSGDQFAVTAPVAVQPSGVLDLQDWDNVIGTLDMTSGQVLTANGILSVASNITVHSRLDAYSRISGRLNLLGAGDSQTFWIFDTLLMDARIHGGPVSPLIKNGAGVMWLNNSNGYSGATLIKGGVIAVNNSHALGASSEGTTVSHSGRIWLPGMMQVALEPLAFTGTAVEAFSAVGTNSWTGPLSLGVNTAVNVYSNGLLNLSGTISGSGELRKTGFGTLRLSGDTANTYSGGTVVAVGTLQLYKLPGVVSIPGSLAIGDDYGGINADRVRLFNPQQIANTAAVVVVSSGLLDVNGQADTVGSVEGPGDIHLGAGLLITGGNNLSTTLAGSITGIGSAGLTKEGSGTLTLTGTNTYPGATTINGGKLLINGTQPASAVTVKAGGTLGGSGVTGLVTAQGGTISPGNSPGQLTSGSASLLTNSILEIELNGLLPGTNCDQLNVAGAVNVGGATLNATLGFASAVSNQFMIVRNDGNDPVAGAFKGLPEGATTSFSGAQFRISYAGGTGNDVVLTQLSVAPGPTIGGITKLPNGQIQFTGTGISGLTYTVEANFDLGTTNWLNLGEIAAQAPTGALQFIDLDATQYPQRFYRFVAP